MEVTGTPQLPVSYSGQVRALDAPEWEPLRLAVGEQRLEQFMCLYAVRLTVPGMIPCVVAYAYKHVLSRRYLYLTADGSAYRYTSEGCYQPVSWWDALAHVYAGQPEAWAAAKGQ